MAPGDTNVGVDPRLCALLGTTDDTLAPLQNEWIETALAKDRTEREPQWSDTLAVGRQAFVERVQMALGIRALHRGVEELDGAWVRHDPAPPYRPILHGEMAALSLASTLNSTDS